VPDANRLLVGGGVTYGLLDTVNVQFAVSQVISGGAKINNASRTAGLISGVYHTQATTVSLGVAARF
jgi:long-subunit fatty acid transport protein